VGKFDVLGRAAVLVAVLAAAARASADEAPRSDLAAAFAPPLPRGTTRVHATVRPFLSVLGQGGGAIADMAVEHYFARAPLRLSLELAPLALAVEADGPGSIGHLRLGGAFASDYIELGASIGSRIQHYGGSGISMAGFLRLGALDGLRFTLSYDYVLRRNPYTAALRIGLSNVLAALQVPLSARLALFTEGGLSADRWIYASAGLRHRLVGNGGPGTWIIAGSFGVAWVVDRPECPYPDTGWCLDAAWAAGPTLGLGLERRF
jgi:hypothetical protein